jgi:alginate O-acetyltransferase complex protein AlgI
MLFNSVEFLLFFAVVAVLTFRSGRHRWLVLLIASYVFYMAWRPPFILLLAGQTLFCWWSAGRVAAATGEAGRRGFLTLNIAVNLLLLGFFKYFYFLHDTWYEILGCFVPVGPISHPWTIILPLGISFHTFQGIAYAVDVYRGTIPAERDLGVFALFHSFFPQLIAGPIERAGSLLPQVKAHPPFAAARFRSGAAWFLWGLFKKSCIADVVSPFVSAVYDHPSAYGASYLLLATLLFGVQIYGDFSGYSEMALGAARILGIELTLNFRQPYVSTSLAEFWRRWHITLSFWFRDYLYFPLGGNRVGPWRWAANIMLVFLISGLWHGAAWTFVIWGCIHGLWLLIEKTLDRCLPAESASLSGRSSSGLRWLVTFAVVEISWVFFRADSLPSAWFILRHLAGGYQALQYQVFKATGLAGYEIIVLVGNLAVLAIADLSLSGRIGWARIWSSSRWRQVALVLLALDVICHGVFAHATFIYFQF